jgi:hypothetical protein
VSHSSNGTLHVAAPAVSGVGDDVVLSTTVALPAQAPKRLWFSVPERFAHLLAASADACLPVLMAHAMARGLDLHIDAPVSARLLDGSRRVMARYAEWSGADRARLRPVHIVAPTASPVPASPMGARAGSLFSGGVDSIFTVLRNHERHPHGDPQRIEYIIIAHGLDVKLDDHRLFEQVLANAQEFARAMGVMLVPLRTNARAFVDSLLDWGHYGHGPCLASVSHALASGLHTITIGSTYWHDIMPTWASHPEIDPLWSSERLQFVHDGAEVTRFEKVRVIARSDPALRALRVCWRNSGGQFNCGACEKCLRTMFALAAHGALARAARFPERLDLELVSALRLVDSDVAFWEDNISSAIAGGFDPTAVAAAQAAIGRWRYRRSWFGRADFALTAILRRLSISGEQLKRWDRLTGSMGARIAEHIKRRRD